MSDLLTHVTVEEAQRIVGERMQSLGTEYISISNCLGRTLAGDVFCDTDVPMFDRTLRDGYAVRVADLRSVPADLKVVGSIEAGGFSTCTLGEREAVQINTGAPLPPGCDAVVMVEHTQASDSNSVTINKIPKASDHVCRAGAYVRKGERILKAGTLLGPCQIGAAATAGAARMQVYMQPEVSVLITGDEVVDVDKAPAGSQIRDCNGPMLMALLSGSPYVASGRSKLLGPVRDDKKSLLRAVAEGLEADCLLVTGGISMGTKDLVPDVLRECGVQMHFAKMRTKPGRPTLFGTTNRPCYVFGLPGNPVSAFIGFWLLVKPALAAMQGREGEMPKPVRARLQGTAQATGNRQSYWPARVRWNEGGSLLALPLSWGGSGDPFGMVEANGLLVRPPHAQAIGDGATVDVVLLGQPA